MLRFADILLGESGEPRCSRCGGRSAESFRDAADVIASVREAADSWGSPPGPDLALTGAEPFRHPSLHQVLTAAVDAGAQRIRLDTDCSALEAPRIAEDVLAAGVRHLRFTLLGPTTAAHDSLAGSEGALTRLRGGVRTFENAARAKGLRVHVTARLPVCRHNLEHISPMVTLAEEIGASSVTLVIDDPHLDLRAAAPWLEAACDTGIVNSLWVEVEGVPYGLACGWELHLACVYRRVAGAKSEVCATCALDDVCPGAIPGAGHDVTSAFRPPAGARQMAEGVARGFEPPLGRCERV